MDDKVGGPPFDDTVHWLKTRLEDPYWWTTEFEVPLVDEEDEGFTFGRQGWSVRWWTTRVDGPLMHYKGGVFTGGRVWMDYLSTTRVEGPLVDTKGGESTGGRQGWKVHCWTTRVEGPLYGRQGWRVQIESQVGRDVRDHDR